MITVDIVVPYLGVSYDFSLDENAEITFIIEEIVSMICAKERWQSNASPQNLDLYDVKKKKRLDRFSCLSMEGVLSGQQLLLC